MDPWSPACLSKRTTTLELRSAESALNNSFVLFWSIFDLFWSILSMNMAHRNTMTQMKETKGVILCTAKSNVANVLISLSAPKIGSPVWLTRAGKCHCSPILQRMQVVWQTQIC
jgi:hypothetical protein